MTIRNFIERHPNATMNLTTPFGHVLLTPEGIAGLLRNEGIKADPGASGCDMEICADEVLEQVIHSAGYKNGVWGMLTDYSMNMTPQEIHSGEKALKAILLQHSTDNDVEVAISTLEDASGAAGGPERDSGAWAAVTLIAAYRDLQQKHPAPQITVDQQDATQFPATPVAVKFSHMEAEPDRTLDAFWSVLDQARETAAPYPEVADHLMETLSYMQKDDLLLWGKMFDAYHQLAYKEKLWQVADILDGGFCSDDGFIDFRAWLILQGREVYTAALSDPDTLAYLGVQSEVRYQQINYAAANAYEQRGYGHYCDDIGAVSLPEGIRTEMESEIRYGADMDKSVENPMAVFPKLCELYLERFVAVQEEKERRASTTDSNLRKSSRYHSANPFGGM
ncbi:MAG: DUF4240 domain-containing protein [Oscillospiraceae bacterium]